MSQLKDLREKRAAAHAEAVKFLKVAEQTAETRQSADAALAEVDTLGADIARIEKADKVAAELAAGQENRSNPIVNNDEKSIEVRAKEYRKAYISAIRQGNLVEGRWVGDSNKNREILDREVKAQKENRDIVEGAPMLTHIGTYTGLGYFVPTGFTNAIEEATKYFCPLLDGSVITIMETATGQPLPMPTNNDTTNVATIVGEAATVNELDVTASQINFAAYKFTSGLVQASVELLQDSAFDLEAWLTKQFAIRWGRGLENYLTNGTGSSQPTGLLTAIAASGATAVVATGSSETTGGSQTGANSIGYSDLVTLEHSVDPSYRRGAKYMFHDLTLSSLKKIIDKYGRPLWVPGISANVGDTINGYSYVINQSMPQIGSVSEAVTVAFGDFSKFIARKVKDLQVIRLNERYAEQGLVGFISFARLDSNLLDAGTHPINVIQQHS